LYEIKLCEQMKRLIFPILTALVLLATSCQHYETYSDRKAKERSAIDRFIQEEGIEVISEEMFKAQGETTDTAQNQYVRLSRSGVYMQIIRPGYGNKIEENKTINIYCRFMEKNIMTDSVMLRNDERYLLYSSTGYQDMSQYPDKMSVKRTGTTITASFVSGAMYTYHGSAQVPSGWLVPLNYVSVDVPPAGSDEEIAKVRLIVPHSQGTADATSSVYPCYYEITYVKER